MVNAVAGPARGGVSCCPASGTIGVIGGRWKVPIIWCLFERTMRFCELHRHLSPVTQKMLAQQLRELERDGILVRRAYPQVPPKVEYSLTAAGKSLRPLIDEMCRWGKKKAGAKN